LNWGDYLFGLCSLILPFMLLKPASEQKLLPALQGMINELLCQLVFSHEALVVVPVSDGSFHGSQLGTTWGFGDKVSG